MGEGYSSPVVAEGCVIQCHRIEDRLQVECLPPATGTRLWTFKHDMKFRDGAFFDNGPRPTPAIRGGKRRIDPDRKIEKLGSRVTTLSKTESRTELAPAL